MGDNYSTNNLLGGYTGSQTSFPSFAAGICSSPTSRPSSMLDSSPSALSPISTSSLTTPPASLRQYSTALKAMMAQGMSAAMADMQDDTREAERSFDMEFGYDDEDPIERHVRMHLTPSRVKVVDRRPRGVVGQNIEETMAQRQQQQQQQQQQPQLHEPEALIHTTEEQGQEMDEAVDNPKHFRPGLIHFHRTHSSNRRTMPCFTSFTSSDATSNGGSGASTPFGDEADTPGSMWSEASFEAIKPEDVASLYGLPYPANNSSGSFVYPFPASGLSAPFEHGEKPIDRTSILSTSSTCTALSSASTVTDSTCKPSRPPLGRPRPRTGPYPGSVGERQKEREHAVQIGAIAEDDEAWMEGRTISEQMILQAGVRCQRGRGVFR
ncbi:hypothetical protein DB88DRAFT_92921 [Papiliotrema laurentii]|uniref:Uncharacterized protein n=1 Tax=Papiliotrema laurentii TaxID=5418 RepID=A0AAD9CTF3_PAPLA|nr:hypothetical protein DB88DRAFT_92921 [Papiliotrema laurentii]